MKLPRWIVTLTVLCIAQLFTQMAFSSYLPSMAYFVQELGRLDYAAAARWAAVLGSADAFAGMVAAPVWGSLADRFGRKLMLVRATLMGAMLVLPMAYVSDLGQLVPLRALQGMFCGTVAASMALVCTQTPEEHLGLALGMMQMAQFVGRSVGPLAGGLVVDTYGYPAVFTLASGLMAASALGIGLLIKERFERLPTDRSAGRASWRGKLMLLLTANIVALLGVQLSITFSSGVTNPVLALYVKSLEPTSQRLGTLAGAAMSVVAVSSSVSSLIAGRVGDRIGHKILLVVCALGAGVVSLAAAYVTTPAQLIVLRAAQGLFYGGLVPPVNALLAKSTPIASRGLMFGISGSIGAAGRALGPLAGGAAASLWGLPSAFVVAAVTFVLAGGAIAVWVRPMHKAASTSPPV